MINSKKLQELCEWKHIDKVNELLDGGESPFRVYEWVTANGFKISHPMVYKYAKHRKVEAITKRLAGKYITPIDTEALRGELGISATNYKSGRSVENERYTLQTILQLTYNALNNQEVD
ncbi:MAG: hypothetical protein FWD71_10365 [Oscillospiraceae bacterium]|nr:hypothetical protein [Oscillospiraceae bacterium]